MSFGFTLSSYKQYKNNTSAFTTWLGRAAEACGRKPNPTAKLSAEIFQPANNTSSSATPKARLKGKARKAAKQVRSHLNPGDVTNGLDSGKAPAVKEYAITTQELSEQIDAVAQSESGMTMPSGIRRMLQRAIDVRTRCANWYESAHEDSASLDEMAHRFFIGVLQDALLKLAPVSPFSSKPASGTVEPPTKEIGTTITGNGFSALEVKDVDDNFEISPTDVVLAARPRSKNASTVDVYVLEEEKAFAENLAIFCFFEDLHRIQDKVKKLWEDCIAGETNLVVATAITHSAITCIRRAEIELCATLAINESDENCYAWLAVRLLIAGSLKGGNRLGSEEVEVTANDDFLYLPTARILLKYAEMAKSEKEWPLPALMTIKWNYLDRPGEIDAPELKKLQAEDELLSQLLLDFQLWEQKTPWPHETRFSGIVQADIFWKTMCPLWSKGQVSVTRVVTARMLLDINEICGDKLPRLYGHLVNAENHVRDTLKLHTDPNVKDSRYAVSSHGDLEWPNLKDDYAYQTLFEMAYIFDTTANPRLVHIKSTMMARALEPNFNKRPMGTLENVGETGLSCTTSKLQSSFGHMNFDFIRPAKDRTFALIHNPLWSGSVMLRLLLEYHSSSLCLASHHASIFATAHLYNALRQLKMLDQPWPLMDRIIKLHKKSIFADVIPTKILDMRNRFFYRSNDRCDLHESEKIAALGNMAEDDFPSQNRALWLLEQEMISAGGGRYISAMEDAYSSLLDDVTIDYIALTKQCIKLLDKFRAMWQVEIDNQRLPIDLTPCHDDSDQGQGPKALFHYHACIYAFLEAISTRTHRTYSYAAGDGYTQAQKGRVPDINDPRRHGTGLLTAAKVFKNFLSKGDVVPRFPLSFSGDPALLDAMADQKRAKLENYRLRNQPRDVESVHEDSKLEEAFSHALASWSSRR